MCNTMESSNELIAMSSSNQLDVTEDILAAANRRIAQLDKIVKLSISRTNANDWVDQSGKPYLTCSGAEKIARLFGVCWKDVKSEKIISSDEQGQYYFYEFSGVFTLGADSITAVGTCSQKDQFFAKVGGQMKPLSEIDETNIRKAAYSNMVVNGVTRILGIRNLTWDEVKEGGIDPSKTSKVTYGKGGNGGGKISEAQAKRFFAIAKGAGKTDEEIKSYLRETFHIESTKDIKTTDYDALCEWAGSKEGEN